MKVGDLVRHVDNDSFKANGYAIVIDFKPRGLSRDHDPTCDVWNDAVVMFSCGTGPYFVMRKMLEAVNESW